MMRRWVNMSSIYKFFLLFTVSMILPFLGIAQVDSLTYYVDMWGGGANQPYMPHWLVASRYGVIDDDHSQVGLLKRAAPHFFE